MDGNQTYDGAHLAVYTNIELYCRTLETNVCQFYLN